jgi:hypothetical protein
LSRRGLYGQSAERPTRTQRVRADHGSLVYELGQASVMVNERVTGYAGLLSSESGQGCVRIKTRPARVWLSSPRFGRPARRSGSPTSGETHTLTPLATRLAAPTYPSRLRQSKSSIAHYMKPGEAVAGMDSPDFLTVAQPARQCVASSSPAA